MSEEKLMDCPFCGTNSICIEVQTGVHGHHVVCKTCYCEGPSSSMYETAVTFWNTRQSSEAVNSVLNEIDQITKASTRLLKDKSNPNAIVYGIMGYELEKIRSMVAEINQTTTINQISNEKD